MVWEKELCFAAENGTATTVWDEGDTERVELPLFAVGVEDVDNGRMDSDPARVES